ncbi:MAG: N-acetyltransferase [Tissierella sp.]|nr:N-acetyltransferase [Tissierella sp.]
MIIRTESKSDYNQVFKVNYEAFRNREDEPKLVEKIRNSEKFIPELSIVAEENNQILGHILLSKADVIEEDINHEVIVLAPIAVKPEFQNKGIGSLLIQEGLKRCKNLGYGLVLLIGHPTYYPKFGFKPARQYGLELKQFNVTDEVFMVCEVIKGELDRIKGELRYPETFL